MKPSDTTENPFEYQDRRYRKEYRTLSDLAKFTNKSAKQLLRMAIYDGNKDFKIYIDNKAGSWFPKPKYFDSGLYHETGFAIIKNKDVRKIDINLDGKATIKTVYPFNREDMPYRIRKIEHMLLMHPSYGRGLLDRLNSQEHDPVFDIELRLSFFTLKEPLPIDINSLFILNDDFEEWFSIVPREYWIKPGQTDPNDN